MLKNTAKSLFLVILMSLSSCSKQNDEVTSVINDQVIYNDTLDSSYNIKDLYSVANDQNEFPYSNLVISNSTYDYGYNQYTLDKNINHLLFINDTLNSISFSNNEIRNLKFVNCYIDNLLITSSQLKNLFISNCKIKTLEIISSLFENVTVNTTKKDTIHKVLIKNCEKSKDILFNGNFNQIILDGGTIDNLNVAKIESTHTDLKIMGTKLLHTNFYNNHSNNIEVFANSTITPASFNTDFILFDDRQLDEINSYNSYKTSRVEIFNRFRFVEQTYSILSEKMKSANDKKLANYFDYKKNKTHNLLNQSYLSNKLNVLWHEYFRGNYGTSIVPILITFLCIWIVFAFCYLLLGQMNFVFFYYKTTNDEGVTNNQSYFTTLDKKLRNIHRYLSHCIWFSLSQMFAGSIISSLNFGRFTSLYLTPPRKYFPVGIGIIISILQNVIGIILVFNFITTFINISLK